MSVRAPVMDRQAVQEWRDGRSLAEMPAHIAATGIAPVQILGDLAFLWICSGCGGSAMGTFGAEPVSGWNEPRWTREGDDEHLTLSPSLGCSGWRDGSCPGGHYWLRNGILEPA